MVLDTQARAAMAVFQELLTPHMYRRLAILLVPTTPGVEMVITGKVLPALV